jgi:hypothetical protein
MAGMRAAAVRLVLIGFARLIKRAPPGSAPVRAMNPNHVMRAGLGEVRRRHKLFYPLQPSSLAGACLKWLISNYQKAYPES